MKVEKTITLNYQDTKVLKDAAIILSVIAGDARLWTPKSMIELANQNFTEPGIRFSYKED